MGMLYSLGQYKYKCLSSAHVFTLRIQNSRSTLPLLVSAPLSEVMLTPLTLEQCLRLNFQ